MPRKYVVAPAGSTAMGGWQSAVFGGMGIAHIHEALQNNIYIGLVFGVKFDGGPVISVISCKHLMYISLTTAL